MDYQAEASLTASPPNVRRTAHAGVVSGYIAERETRKRVISLCWPQASERVNSIHHGASHNDTGLNGLHREGCHLERRWLGLGMSDRMKGVSPRHKPRTAGCK
jgi:hypothetical protein